MKKSDMLANARAGFPQFFTWAAVSGHNRVESLLVPVQDPEDALECELWYPGIWECQFDPNGEIISVGICKILKKMAFNTEEECEVAIQRMPF